MPSLSFCSSSLFSPSIRWFATSAYVVVPFSRTLASTSCASSRSPAFDLSGDSPSGVRNGDGLPWSFGASAGDAEGVLIPALYLAVAVLPRCGVFPGVWAAAVTSTGKGIPYPIPKASEGWGGGPVNGDISAPAGG
ncbi:MAG: hypothetical protein Q8P67_15075, partial [archaeon]|nr:hypothetical protein [archaeon]